MRQAAEFITTLDVAGTESKWHILEQAFEGHHTQWTFRMSDPSQPAESVFNN